MTTSSGVHNIDIFVSKNNYHRTDMPRAYWAKYSQYDLINVGMNSHSIVYTISYDDVQNFVWENDYWTAA